MIPPVIEVQADMIASVVAVAAAPGSVVAAGDTLLVLESMKMEIPVPAPLAGTVVEIRVGAGDVVEVGDVLAVLRGGEPA